MYQFLEGTRVVEVSLLAPDSAGQHLADLGADVIKVEGPPHGDYVRRLGGGLFVGDTSVLHLRWNRGKRSIWMDLKTSRGKDLLRELLARSEVLIDGLRWGVLERLGFSYEVVQELNPALVYCSLTGVGRSGPYTKLATHGVFYDAYAGWAPAVYPDPDGIPRIPTNFPSIGTDAAGIYAALAIVSALLAARRTGRGSLLEVAESDVAATWSPNVANARLNGVARSAGPPITASVRYSYYKTKDDGLVVFQASEEKFWRHFCLRLDRSDLLERFPSAPVGDHASGNEELRQELQDIFRSRTRAEWVEFFIEADVPGGPVYLDSDFLEDPHFQARALTYSARTTEGEDLRLIGTPIKVTGEEFSATMAPGPGEHTAAVLADVLDMDSKEIESYLSECAPPARE